MSERLYHKMTPEDSDIQRQRVERATLKGKAQRQFTGWCMGRGYEYDHFDALHMSELTRFFTERRKWTARVFSRLTNSV